MFNASLDKVDIIFFIAVGAVLVVILAIFIVNKVISHNKTKQVAKENAQEPVKEVKAEEAKE